MSGLIIDSEACIGCGRCVRACASGGIVVEGERPNRCARVTDGCILCGGCVDACPVNAISIERDEAAGAVDLDAYRDIWAFVQTDEHDTVTPVAYELMGKGRELADARGCRLVALVGMSPEGSLGGPGASGLRGRRRSPGLSRRAPAPKRCGGLRPLDLRFGSRTQTRGHPIRRDRFWPRTGTRRCRAFADGPYG